MPGFLKKMLGAVCGLMIAGAIALPGGPAAAQEKVTLRLDWVNSGYHAIWYYGIDQGIFKQQGIDLEVLEGNGSSVTAQTVGNGSVMFGTADAGSVMGLVSQGMPIKMVAGYLRQNPMAVIFPTSNNWHSYADLKDKAVIGTSPGGASAQLLPAVLKATGLQGKVKLVSMEPAAKMTALLVGKVNCIESFDFLMVSVLEGKGLKVSTIPYAAAGVKVPGLALVASNDTIQKKPALVRKMVAGMEKAIAAAKANPDAAIDSLLKRSPTLDRGVVTRTLKLSFNLLEPDWAKGHPFGWLSPEEISRSQDILLQYGGVKAKKPIDTYFTNDFLPAS